MFDSIAESLEKIRLGEDALLEMTEGRFEEHYTANILHWLNFSVSLRDQNELEDLCLVFASIRPFARL
jgi:hypothetical protein